MLLRATFFCLVFLICLHTEVALAGQCQNAEFCEDPCPAEGSCTNDDDCGEGRWCVPACLPSSCLCNTDTGLWAACTDDCAWKCVDIPVSSGAEEYEIVNLGTLGGVSSVALGVNDKGHVVGGADTADGYRHAFIWLGDAMFDLGTWPGHLYSEAWDINNADQVVGISGVAIGGWKAVMWDHGEIIDLGSLNTGSVSALAINDTGQVVGVTHVPGGEEHAFLWENGQMTDLGTLGGTRSVAWDINELGQVVGRSFLEPGQHAFLWDEDVMLDLGSLTLGTSEARGINDSTMIVGRSAAVSPGQSAFIWESGVMTDLGALGGFLGSDAEAINNLGQVVGNGSTQDEAYTFLYDPLQGMRFFRDLIPPERRAYSQIPRDMSNRTEIVGDAIFVGPGGGLHAFFMFPVANIPAASTWSVVSLALLVLVAGTVMINRRGFFCGSRRE